MRAAGVVEERLRLDFEGSLQGLQVYTANSREETEVVVEDSAAVVITDAQGRAHAG